MNERYDLENTKGWLIDQIKDCNTCDDLDALISDCAEDIEHQELTLSTEKESKNNG